MQRVAVVVLVAILVIAGGVLGYLIGSNSSGGQKVSTSKQTPGTLTTCTISGEAIGVALRVMAIDYSNHDVVPVAGAGVTGSDVLYCNDQRQSTRIQYAQTNTTGWVDLFDGGGGIYYLNVTYPDSNLIYSLSIPVQPVTATYATFNASTGNVTVHFCEYNFQCLAE